MGTTIEFDRCAVEFEDPAADNTYTASKYLLAAEIGADNSFDSRTGKIARSWSFIAIGDEQTVIKELTLAAGDIESGMFRYQNGKTKTENYLANWRDELRNNAIPVADFADKFPNAELVVSNLSDPDDESDSVWEAIHTVTTSWDRHEPENGDTPEYRAAITVEALAAFEQLQDNAHLHVDLKR